MIFDNIDAYRSNVHSLFLCLATGLCCLKDVVLSFSLPFFPKGSWFHYFHFPIAWNWHIVVFMDEPPSLLNSLCLSSLVLFIQIDMLKCLWVSDNLYCPVLTIDMRRSLYWVLITSSMIEHFAPSFTPQLSEKLRWLSFFLLLMLFAFFTRKNATKY